MKSNKRLADYAWPLGIILLLAVSMATSLSIVFWSRVDGGAQVVENYYQRAVSWDSTAFSARRLTSLGWTHRLDVTPVELVVTLRDGNQQPVFAESLVVKAYRPSRAAAVHVWRLRQVGTDIYSVHTGALAPGVWDFVTTGRAPGGAFQFEDRREAGVPPKP